jgi:hypothetical protein
MADSRGGEGGLGSGCFVRCSDEGRNGYLLLTRGSKSMYDTIVSPNSPLSGKAVKIIRTKKGASKRNAEEKRTIGPNPNPATNKLKPNVAINLEQPNSTVI